MGEVYKARDTRLGRTVAIKVLPANLASDPERRRRFEHEARAVSALSHPNICTLHDIGSEPVAGTSERRDYLVMEFLEGETLAQRLRRGAMPLEQALDIGAQVADALAKAHRHGIVHRDLKPANIMLVKSGAGLQPKLLDFGLAKLRPRSSYPAVGVSRRHGSSTTPGAVMGTVPTWRRSNSREGNRRPHGPVCIRVRDLRIADRPRAFTGATAASIISAIMTLSRRR